MGRTASSINRAAFLAVSVFLGLLPALSAQAQIRINEIYADPAGASDLNERVEIYNAGTTAIDVTGWGIHDAATIDGNPALRCRLPEDFDTAACPGGAVIQPGEFRLVKSTTVMAWTNNAGDDIYLCSNRTIPAVVVHQVTYGSTVGFEDSSWAARPNGSSNFTWRAKTLCATNGSIGDVTAPGTVSDLAAAPGPYSGEIVLTWTATGDDGAAGTASLYEIMVSHDPITPGNFTAAAPLERWINEPVPAAGGAPETLVVFGLDPDSLWYFALRAQDEVPNTGGVSNSPGTMPFAGPLLNPDLGTSVYFGNLHSHTGYSDGVQTPADAYQFARYTAQTPLDFLAVTEHNHSQAGKSLPDYSQGLAQAAAANDDGNFVAIFGQEWGVANDGHVNIFESPVLYGWESGNHDVFVPQSNYPALYAATLANPPANGYPVLLEWCHPATTNFNNLEAGPDARAAVHLMALVNGPFDYALTDESGIGNTNFDGAFQQALFNGMRVSPTADQDNHMATWGAASESRTAVHAAAKTKSEILASLAAGRCYATQDHDVRVDFSAEGRPMGSAFASATGVRIAVQVTDPDSGETSAQIDLFRGVTGISNAVRVAWNEGSSTFQWREQQTFDPGTEAHYYLRIRMLDNQNIWTGPIYVTYDPSTPLSVSNGRASGSGLTLAASPNPAPRQITATFSVPRAESRAVLAVYDPSGGRVRTLHAGPLAAGQHRIAWDGLSDAGSPVRAGVFFLRLEAGVASASRKFAILR